MRTITIRSADDTAFQNFYEANYEQASAALSYLTQWALHNYQHVEIFVQRDGEMTAIYYRDDASKQAHIVGYFLAAIWHDDEDGARYTYHS